MRASRTSPACGSLCSFTSDVYRVFDLLTEQDDITTVDVRDYIARPKPNGYRSLHALVGCRSSSRARHPVTVEVQFRTIAMDFWASLEHKIYYKVPQRVPAELTEGCAEAAETSYALDATMGASCRRCAGSGAAEPWSASCSTAPRRRRRPGGRVAPDRRSPPSANRSTTS